jgi:hypothetical protein
MMLAQDLVGDMITRDEIVASRRAFDVTAPLTEFEQSLMANRFDVSRTPAEAPRDLEDELYTFREPVAAEAPVNDPTSYNAEYANYLRWQLIAAMVAHDDAWKAFQELVLLPFVRQRKQEDDAYQGSDRDEAFVRRCRRLNAEEFVRHILALTNDAGQVAKPVLMGGK